MPGEFLDVVAGDAYAPSKTRRRTAETVIRLRRQFPAGAVTGIGGPVTSIDRIRPNTARARARSDRRAASPGAARPPR